MLNANELLEIAKDETKNLISGEVFLLRDLFKGYEWNRIPRTNRLLLGTLFLNYIKSTDTVGVVLNVKLNDACILTLFKVIYPSILQNSQCY